MMKIYDYNQIIYDNNQINPPKTTIIDQHWNCTSSKKKKYLIIFLGEFKEKAKLK